MSFYHGLPNRTLCACLEDMRAVIDKLNSLNAEQVKAVVQVQIEEAQYLGNRMESTLEDIHDIADMYEKRAQLKKDIKELRQELKTLRLEQLETE